MLRQPAWARDAVHHNVFKIRFDLRDRVRILFGRPIDLCVRIACENPVGRLEHISTDLFVHEIFPRREHTTAIICSALDQKAFPIVAIVEATPDSPPSGRGELEI